MRGYEPCLPRDSCPPIQNGREVHAVWHKFAPVVITLLVCGSSPLFAQERVEVGMFVDYLSISQTNTNNFGLGGRFGYRIHRKLTMEGELAYDYGINFHEAYRWEPKVPTNEKLLSQGAYDHRTRSRFNWQVKNYSVISRTGARPYRLCPIFLLDCGDLRFQFREGGNVGEDLSGDLR
jgi:hypothetical protein